MKASVILLAGAVLSVPTWGQQAASPAPSVQQEFDAATALDDKRDFADALAKWEALEKRTAKNPRSQALVRVRKGGTLLALNRTDEAVEAARAGLAALPAGEPALQGDRFQAYVTLGAVAERSLDYGSAASAYAEAEKLAETPSDRFVALRGLAQTQTFIDPAAAAQAIVRADAVLGGAKSDPQVRATVRRLEGQLLLNRGDFAGSMTQTAAAVKLLGGLTSTTRLDDVSVRSNYAIAALLAGRKEDAREYMAMTGAGRLSRGSFTPGAQMNVPECGGEAGLKPGDLAVIEFSIDDDGAVRRSVPVYAAGGGQVALEFARVARDWSWTPERAKALPVFFRNNVRLELRCSTAFERPSVGTFLDGELGNWLTAQKIARPALLTGADAIILPQLRAQLAQAETAGGRDAPTLVPILHQLIENQLVPRDEAAQLARRELAIATANRVPPAALLAIEHRVWLLDKADRWRGQAFARVLVSHLGDPVYAGDPIARSAIRLLAVDALSRREDEARALLTAVGADGALAANHPLRVGALVRLASLEQGDGNETAAAAAFAQSGLSARQCALVDSAPRLASVDTGSNNFPLEAAGWGFEGWATAQYDVGADGRVLNQRIVAAYPPFIFGASASKMFQNARYEKTYRPDGGLGCGGQTKRVLFGLPD